MQPPAKDQYAKLASLYQKALSEADTSDDPEAYRERARAAYDRAVARVAQEPSPQPSARQEPPPISPVEDITGPRMSPLRAAGTALATGLLPESLAGLGAQLRRPAGESAEAAYQRGMRQLGTQEEQAKEAIGGLGYGALQMAGGMPVAMRFPGVSARVAKDAARLQKAIAAGKRTIGGGIVAGAESAGRQGMEDQALSPVQSAALGAGLTAGLEVGFPVAGALLGATGKIISSIPGVGPAVTTFSRRLAEPIGEVATEGRRAIADYLAPRFGQRGAQLAQMIEPTDITKVQRVVGQQLPTQGQTVEQIRQQALRATESATGLQTALKTAEEAVKESAARTAGRGKALVQRAEQAAARTMQAIENKARTTFANLAQTQGEGAALREATLSEMEAIGQQVYREVQRVRPLPEPPVRIYQQIDKSNPLSNAFEYAQAAKQERRLGERVEQAMGEGVPITERVKTPKTQNYVLGQARNPATGEIEDIKRPVLDLETFDYMKRWVNDKVEAGLAGDVSGISRSQAAGLKKQIQRMEEDFLSAHSPADRAVLEKARSAMREQFERLELIQDGLNLTRFTLNAPAQMRAAAEMDLAELVTQVSQLPEAKRKFFEVPARQAMANLIQSSDQSLEGIARALVGTTQARKRATLALGEETVAQLQRFLPEQIKGAAERAAAPIRQVGERLAERGAAGGGARTQRLAAEAASLAQQLQGQQARAGQLGALAETAQEGISALTDLTAGRGFAATFPGRGLGGAGEREVRGAMAGAIQDQISGLRPAEAIRKLQELRANPAARQVFGSSIDQALAQLQQQQSIFLPLRSAAVGQAAGRF